MLSFLISLLSNPLLDKLLSFFEKRQIASLERDKLAASVTVETIKAEIENRKIQKELLVKEEGWIVTRWIRPIIIYPLAFHLNMVILDSVFNFDWNIAKLPSPMDQWEGTIILSYFLAAPIENLGKNFMSYLRK